MVRAKHEQQSTSSNKTLNENEATDNDLAETKTSDPVSVNVEQPKADVQFEDKVKIPFDQAKNEKNEETNSGERKKAIAVDNDDENTINGDNLAEVDQNTSEDDEIDEMWEDDEENCEEDNEKNAADKDEVSVVETEEDDEESEEDDEESEEEDEELEEDDEESEEEDDDKENEEEEKEIANGDGGKSEEPSMEKVEASLKEEVDKSRGRSRKKVQARSSKKMESRDDEKPESSRKRKAKKRVETMGMIFMCSSTTKNDCYRYRVLGLPASKKNMVEKIYTGMRLFLYDVDLKLLNGIYKAAGPGGYNIEPKAFKSQFPSQVRFTVLEDCLPIAEEKFKKVIKDNYFTNTKFHCLLTSEQVKKLCKLFVATSKGPQRKKLSWSRKVENHTTERRDRPRKQRADEARRHTVREVLGYREHPHKRQRKIINPVAPVRQPLPLPVPVPLPSTVPSYAYERTSEVDAYRQYPYLESRDPYRDGRDPLLNHGDSYRDGRNPPTERHGYYKDGRLPPTKRRDPYRDGRDPPTERRDPYRDGRDPYVERRSPYRDGRERRDSYKDGRDPPTERRDPYRDGRDPYVERRSPYRDARDPYVERRSYRDGQDTYVQHHDPYSDRRDSYLQHRGPYRDGPQFEPYDTYRRDPMSDRHGVYREYRLAETPDSYRQKVPLEHRDLQPTHLETSWLHDIGSQSSFRAHLSYTEPTYSAEYPSRAGLERDYRPVGLLTDHHSTRGRLPEYYARRA